MITLKTIDPLIDDIAFFNSRLKETTDSLNSLYSEASLYRYESEQPGGVNVMGEFNSLVEKYESVLDSLSVYKESNLGINNTSVEDTEIMNFLIDGLDSQFDYYGTINTLFSYNGNEKEYRYTFHSLVNSLVSKNSILSQYPLNKDYLSLLFDLCKKIDAATILINYKTDTYSHGLSINDEISKFQNLNLPEEKVTFVSLYQFLNQRKEEIKQYILKESFERNKINDLKISCDNLKKKYSYSLSLEEKLEYYNKTILERTSNLSEKSAHPFLNRKKISNLKDEILSLQKICDNLHNENKEISSSAQYFIELNNKFLEYSKAFNAYSHDVISSDPLLRLKSSLLFDEIYNVANCKDNTISLIHGKDTSLQLALFQNITILGYEISKISFHKNGNDFPNNIIVSILYSSKREGNVSSLSKQYKGIDVMESSLLSMVEQCMNRSSLSTADNLQQKRACKTLKKLNTYIFHQNMLKDVCSMSSFLSVSQKSSLNYLKHV